LARGRDAAYLTANVTTVSGWEKREGMPGFTDTT